MREEFDNLMRQGAKELSVELSGSQMDGFYRYYELLTEWNKVMNLTAITELHEVVTKHFLDSLSLVKAVSAGELEEARILDLGTGAGFPGIPLKIAFPDMKVTLLDSLNKRIRFLQQVVSELNLSEVEAVHGRAEDYGRQREFRENYDFCVSRAVANFSTLAEYCLPFVRKGGYFISYKSSDVEKELEAGDKALKGLGGRLETVVDFYLPGSQMYRKLVKVKKEKNTPEKYPRKAGLPGKEPL